MVYGIENHGMSYQTSTPACIRRDDYSGVTCENFNSANLIHPQISTTTNSTSGRKRNSNNLISADGCNIDLSGLTREERRRRRRATQKYRTAHATRERIRVEAFNVAFSDLRKLLPTLPPDKKLSKIEILKLAICYISYLNHVLEAP
ncbi:unnamed protein product [Chironomus riparius]|uniref:BHLH domain-containing protein n=1 Tax=Chironomus riparius TaxID=315576 RepID=A0A9N9RY68_9DIPT|nr:unnamed protein product [Chironomus riparius]